MHRVKQDSTGGRAKHGLHPRRSKEIETFDLHLPKGKLFGSFLYTPTEKAAFYANQTMRPSRSRMLCSDWQAALRYLSPEDLEAERQGIEGGTFRMPRTHSVPQPRRFPNLCFTDGIIKEPNRSDSGVKYMLSSPRFNPQHLGIKVLG